MGLSIVLGKLGDLQTLILEIKKEQYELKSAFDKQEERLQMISTRHMQQELYELRTALELERAEHAKLRQLCADRGEALSNRDNYRYSDMPDSSGLSLVQACEDVAEDIMQAKESKDSRWQPR